MNHLSDVRRSHVIALCNAAIVLSFAACKAPDRATVDSAGSVASLNDTTALACPDSAGVASAGLTLPAGFCANVFAEGVIHGRHVAVAGNGDVYIAIEGTNPSPKAQPAGTTPPPATSFVALRDTNRDGRADLLRRIGTLGNTGVALANGYVYVDEGTAIVRYARADTALVPAGKREVVVDGFPLTPGHRARNFVIDTTGSLFVNVGSATNSCQAKDRALGSPGLEPCTELLTRAGIWRFDADRPGQRFNPEARFASGIRNGMGLAVASDGMLYGTQHGRDQLHDNWPEVFPDVAYQAENPGEQLIQINQGDDFGWPHCYYSIVERHLVDAPEYGGDGKTTTRCADKKEPRAVFPAHWAPMSLFIYPTNLAGTDRFPDKYRGGAFIAFHGSWNRTPAPQAGYRVVFQPLSGGEYITFADGFAGLPADQIQPDRAKHRPVGIAAMPDGSLIITDDAGGRVYRVTYRNPAAMR